MSSTELLDAASISMTSSDVALAIATHDSHTPHGSTVGPCTQFRQAARILAIDVLPVPREPTKRFAWWTLPCSTALRRVRTTCSWPTTSAKVRGRWRRYSDGADTAAQPVYVPSRSMARLRAPAGIGALAGALFLVWGHGFANYDTLYALVWGRQIADSEAPSFDVSLAPTPHPLATFLGLLTAPLSQLTPPPAPHPLPESLGLLRARLVPRGAEDVTVVLAFVALAACGFLV